MRRHCYRRPAAHQAIVDEWQALEAKTGGARMVLQIGDLAPDSLWQVVHPELPADFPPLKSLAVHPNNLPRLLPSFIGREKEMAEVSASFPPLPSSP